MRVLSFKFIIVVFCFLLGCNIRSYNGVGNDVLITEGRFEVINIQSPLTDFQQVGTIEGVIRDAQSQLSIQYANIIDDSADTLWSVSDSVGFFKFNLQQGYYTFRVSHVGNTTLIADSVRVQKGKATMLKIYLGTSIIH
jgi:hypothetical protein